MNAKRPLLFVTCALISSAVAHAAPPLPTDQDLQQLFDKKAYRACLQQTARVLALTGDYAKPYDPYILEMRRGECLLNLQDYDTALIIFNKALAVAPTPQATEYARAMVALVQASSGSQYIPIQTPGNPINIVSPATRGDAFRALFADQFAAAAPAIANTAQSTSLIPLINFIPVAQTLHALELAGTGKDVQTRPMLRSLGDRARSLITDELKTLNNQIDQIVTRANQLTSLDSTIVTNNTGQYIVTGARAGLMPQDRTALRDMLSYLSDISTASTRGKQVAQSFGADGLAWDPIIAEAQRTTARAQSTLDAE